MAALVWDQVGERTFESGIDRGVLYLSDGSAIPWNGLTSVSEDSNVDTSPSYYDGMKIGELPSLGEFSATLNAVTYPDEFSQFEGFGLAEATPGVSIGEQRPKTFDLCYRTKLGNDVDGDTVGYKIHVLYNVTAVPQSREFTSLSEQINLSEFSWNLTAVPENLTEFGFAPTAHVVINTLTIDPDLLDSIEAVLYGDESGDAALIPLLELLTLIFGEASNLITITDNNDGTWTADTTNDLLFTVVDDEFEITEANAIFLDASTYRVSNTVVRV